MNSVDFLMAVWDIHCRAGDHVAVAWKTGKWNQRTFPYDDDLPDTVRSWLEENEERDCYFCPLPFGKPRRDESAVSRTLMLWSDIDTGSITRVKPSVLWESSPGRYAGLWLLDRELNRDDAKKINQELTYYIGADKGGWDLTQVLRIPGTKNFKYDPPPTVKLVRFDTDMTYNPFKIVPVSLLDKYRKSLPRSVVRLLESEAEVGKRSEIIWKLENQLLEHKIPVDDVIQLIKDSDWNKFRGRNDEDERFAAEIAKIKAQHSTDPDDESEEPPLDLPVTKYAQLMGSNQSTPGWLIEGFWMRQSHGIVAGEPKSFKSTLTMDLAFSIATGEPFLGQFTVEQTGPVLVVQNENSDWIMRDRLEKLAYARGWVGSVQLNGGRYVSVEWPPEPPMYFVNQQGFSFSDTQQKQRIVELIETLKPVLVIFDPLYLMFDGEINSAKELNPVLNWLLMIRNEYKTAVMVIHHYNKGGEQKRGGQRMLGSTTLHGWIESAWYVRANGEDETEDDAPASVNSASAEASVVVEREFRGAGLYPRIEVGLKLGAFGDPTYETEATVHTGPKKDEDNSDEIVKAIDRAPHPLSQRQLAKETGISRYKIDKMTETLLKTGKIRLEGERYASINRSQ